MTDGILSAHALRTLVGEQRVAALQFHGYTQTASTALVALGFLAIYKNKGRAGKSHITTPHAKVTLLVTQFLLCSSICSTPAAHLWFGILTPLGFVADRLACLCVQLGLVTLAWTLMSILLGASSFRKYGIITIFPLKWQGRIKKAHRLVSPCSTACLQK